MKKIAYTDIFELIAENNMTRASYYLEGKLFNDCYSFVVNRARGLPAYLRLEIFNDAFSKLWEDIVENRCTYHDDGSFLSYFKKGCSFQFFKKIREIARKQKFERYLEEIVHSVSKAEINDEFHNNMDEFNESKLNRYGIHLDVYDEKDEKPHILLKRVSEAFHKLGKTCKKIIFLNIFMGMSHREIADTLDNINNESVSRVLRHRCLERIRIIYKEQNYGKRY